MSDLDAGVLAQKLGIKPERVEKALSEMGVPYSAPPAEPTEPGFYVTADRKWLLWLHSDGTGWGRTETKAPRTTVRAGRMAPSGSPPTGPSSSGRSATRPSRL